MIAGAKKLPIFETLLMKAMATATAVPENTRGGMPQNTAIAGPADTVMMNKAAITSPVWCGTAKPSSTMPTMQPIVAARKWLRKSLLRPDVTPVAIIAITVATEMPEIIQPMVPALATPASRRMVGPKNAVTTLPIVVQVKMTQNSHAIGLPAACHTPCSRAPSALASRAKSAVTSARSVALSQAASSTLSVRTNQATMPNRIDSTPSIRNTHCHPAMPATPLKVVSRRPPSGPLIMPAIAAALANMPTAVARRSVGSHRVRYRITPGNRPASNAPSKNRSTVSIVAEPANMVSAQVMPHSSAIRVSVLRAPMRSSTRLLGTSNSR